MVRQARLKSRTGVYHIMWRGANRQEIFHDDEDCLTFLGMMEKYKKKCALEVYAWCLMNNHVHLLLKEGNESISMTMKRLGVSFVQYYNLKYGTTGHLFQDRFKSENVETNKYLFTVIRYIHQNPVKAGIAKQVDEWRWSSCLGYYGRNYYPNNMLDIEPILSKISANPLAAKTLFKEYNERSQQDQCLEDGEVKRKISDEEARLRIKEVLREVELTQIKSLNKQKRTEVIRDIKTIKGLSIRQIARITGVSTNLVFKA
jgi:putative transposase